VKNLVVALVGIVVPFACGYYYAALMGHSFVYSMFLGAALTATSVGITVAVLEEFKVLSKEFAQVILGAAVIDDILALLVLSIVSGAQTGFEIEPLAYLIASALVFVVGGIYLGQYLVKRYFDALLAGEIENKTFLLVLAYVLAYAYVAEYIGLSAIVGAFIAGITLNFSKNTGKLFSLFYPLEAFFTPIFFISLGMLVEVDALVANLLPIAVVTAIAIIAKVVGCGLSALASGSNAKDSLIIGVGMAPRGEIALIIGLFGLTAGVLSAAEYSIIASMAFITTIITPVILGRLLSQKTVAS
jgi:Kef-type K+ transport system membrane component KefB